MSLRFLSFHRFSMPSPSPSLKSIPRSTAGRPVRWRALTLGACLAAALLSAGCSKVSQPPQTAQPQQAQPQIYKVRAILRGINFAEQTVTVEHEEIPDYMPAMTMPFDYKSQAEIEPLKVGDGMAFDLVVTDTDSWIESVKKIAPGEVQLPARRTALAKAGENVERLKDGDRLPAFELVDQQSRRITPVDFAGRPLLVTFIFTRCPIPNFCPLMSQNFQKVQQALSDTPALAARVRYLSISFDPAFDTPEVLSQYAARYTRDAEQWRFATGTPEQVDKLTKAFSVYVQPESGTLSHGLCTALVDGSGVIRKMWRGNSWDASEIVTALRGLGESSSALPPGSAAAPNDSASATGNRVPGQE
jgi:protein SCO1